jgi:ribonuclease G
MAREILINVEQQEKSVAIVNNGRLEEFYIERPQDKTIVGNVYKGSIEAVLPSINGAFVNIGMEKNGFLYLTEIESSYDFSDGPGDKPAPVPPPQPSTVQPLPGQPGQPQGQQQGNRNQRHGRHGRQQQQQRKPELFSNIKKGQEVLVQVEKEPFGTKGPRLSCHVGIPGRYLVMMPFDKRIGMSRRIEDEAERKRLRQVFQELKLPQNIGFIVRTVAAGKNRKELIRDANYLLYTWKSIEKKANQAKPPSLVHAEYDLVLRVIRDSLNDEVSKLIVDNKPEFYRIHRFIGTFNRDMRRKLEFYRGHDLFGDKGIDKQIGYTFEKKVFMKSKAYIIIEPTEGLVVVDVNSGGFREKIEQEMAAFKINCEAAQEVAHQLKLRDLGGIIVIDFIDMEREGHRREVLRVLKEALSTDRAKYDVMGISKFGLVEMTRERIHNTVQTMSFQDCPYCAGKGKVKSPATMAIYALKELRKHLALKQPKEVELSLHPAVVDELQKTREALKEVERRFRTRINLNPCPSLRMEDISIT